MTNPLDNELVATLLSMTHKIIEAILVHTKDWDSEAITTASSLVIGTAGVIVGYKAYLVACNTFEQVQAIATENKRQAHEISFAETIHGYAPEIARIEVEFEEIVDRLREPANKAIESICKIVVSFSKDKTSKANYRLYMNAIYSGRNEYDLELISLYGSELMSHLMSVQGIKTHLPDTLSNPNANTSKNSVFVKYVNLLYSTILDGADHDASQQQKEDDLFEQILIPLREYSLQYLKVKNRVDKLDGDIKSTIKSYEYIKKLKTMDIVKKSDKALIKYLKKLDGDIDRFKSIHSVGFFNKYPWEYYDSTAECSIPKISHTEGGEGISRSLYVGIILMIIQDYKKWGALYNGTPQTKGLMHLKPKPFALWWMDD